MRAFIAVDIPASLLSQISEIIEECRRYQRRDIRYVDSENIHLTLKFLDEIHNEQTQLIIQSLEGIGKTSFELGIRGVGGFPNIFYPKTLWVGVQKNKNLSLLASDIESRCAECGIPRENRAFSPHITIGRLKGNIDKALGEALLKEKDRDFGSFLVSEYHLYRSQLTPTGPIYDRIKTFALAESNQ